MDELEDMGDRVANDLAFRPAERSGQGLDPGPFLFGKLHTDRRDGNHGGTK